MIDKKKSLIIERHLMAILKKIRIGIVIIIADLYVYLILGLLLMDYDDFYKESKGEYWSLASMTKSQQVTYFCFNLWNVVNVTAMGYVIYHFLKNKKYPEKSAEA